MSTAGRINKSGHKFVPRRKNVAPSSTASSAPSKTHHHKDPAHASTNAITPKHGTTALPALNENDAGPSGPGLVSPDSRHEHLQKSPTSASTTIGQGTSPNRTQALPANPTKSPGSAFGPSDPSLRFTSSQPAPSSSPSQPTQSTSASFSFTPRDPSSSTFPSTQATSVGPSSQPPRSSQPSTSRSAGTPFAVGGSFSQEEPDERDQREEARGKSASSAGIAVGRTVEEEEGGAEGDEPQAPGKKNPSQKPTSTAGRKRAAPARRAAKGKSDAGDIPVDDEGVSGTQTGPRPSRGGPAKRRGARKPGKGEGESTEDEDSEGEALAKAQKRKARGAKQKGKEKDVANGGDRAAEADGGQGSSGSDEGGEAGDRRPETKRKKRSGKERSSTEDVHEEFPTVDPTQTTMSELAEINPKFDLGRPSERTLFFEQQKIDKKAAMRLKRQKMKARQKRIAAGLPASEEEDEADEPEQAGATRDKGKGKEKEDSVAAGGAASGRASQGRDASPQAVDAAAAMAMIAGMRPLEEDEDGNPIAGPSGENGHDEEDDAQEDEDGYGDLVETTFAPQMRIVDGQLVIDEESLQIDRSKPTNTDPREVIEENAQDRFVNSRSFSRKPGKAKKWTVDDTERFYDALSQFGTDFELIAALFPGRTRREIKLKWTKEDKINPKKITMALMRRKKIDLDSYTKYSGQDLSGPMPEDPMEEINERRAKLEAEGQAVMGGSHRRGQNAAGAVDAGKGAKGKGKKKKGAVDEAGAALFDEERLRREQEEEDQRRMQAEIEEEERQARIDAMDDSD